MKKKKLSSALNRTKNTKKMNAYSHFAWVTGDWPDPTRPMTLLKFDSTPPPQAGG